MGTLKGLTWKMPILDNKEKLVCISHAPIWIYILTQDSEGPILCLWDGLQY